MSAAAPQQQPSEEQNGMSKSEIGWSFVEQYYSFLNQYPEKLHLFYNKSSTVCHGNEGEMVPSYKGQTKIQNRIKEHNFQDCKVMVSNVDCQESATEGVVIQVLGEMANRNEPSQKFVQTFFLAPQPTGYYVLNDIFRFLKEDVDEEDEVPAQPAQQQTQSPVPPQSQPQPPQQVQPSSPQPVQQAPVPAPAPAPASVQAAAPAQAAQVQAQAQTQTQAPAPAPAPPAAEAPKEPKEAKEATPPPAAEKTKEAKPNGKQVEEKKEKEVKKEKKVPAPAKPAAPLSWASRLAASKAESKAAPPTAPAAEAPSPSPAAPAPKPAAAAATAASAAPANNGTANGKKNAVAAANAATATNPAEFHSAYIKHVGERVDEKLLYKELSKVGKLTHFQVEKQKNCAFVDFVDDATLQKALKVHELKVGEHTVLIEERKRGGAKKNPKKANANRVKK